MNVEGKVETLGLENLPAGDYLKRLWNSDSGQYALPFFPDMADQVSSFVSKIRSLPDARKRESERPLSLVRVAFLDTGLMSSHPLIQPFLAEAKDFTGEGIEDLNGHGTTVALVHLIGSIKFAMDTNILPLVCPEFVNAKVVPESGVGKEDDLIEGLAWAKRVGVDLFNMSVGIYRRKWGLFACDGWCRVCRAARDVTSNGALVFAAAGNDAGMTACPGTVGLVDRNSQVICVGSSDSPSGPAATYGKGVYPFVHFQ